MEPFVSVIIPAYNAEKTIERCIRSVTNQIYNNLEIIIIDDGSVDKTAEICASLRKEDTRIHYYYQTNSGVGCARNNGINKSTGQYLVFLDSDDCMKDSLISDNVKMAETNSSDLVIFGFTYINPSNGHIVENKLADFVGSAKTFFDYELQTIVYTEALNAPWNKLIKKTVVEDNNLEFSTDFSICEDIIFSINCLRFAKKIVINEKTYYDYYIYEQSSLRSRYHSNFFEAAGNVYKNALLYCSLFTNNEKQIILFSTFYAQLVIAQIKRIVKCKELSNIEKKEILVTICSDEQYRDALKLARFKLSNINLFKKKIIRRLILKKKVCLIFIIYKLKD